jgi:hypothetical protein
MCAHHKDLFMTEQKSEFNWDPLGEAFWTEAAATTGATMLQARFACCRHRGMTATGAARLAGYTADGDGIRQSGSRAAKSTAVMNLLALAVAEAGGGDDGVVDSAEARRILSRLARGSDPNVRIKAIESLGKIEQNERSVTTEPETMLEIIRATLNCYHGVGHAALSFLGVIEAYGPRFNLGALPLFPELAPQIATQYPETWARIRNALDSDCKADADAAAAGPGVPIEQLVAKPTTTEMSDAAAD